MFRKKNNTGEPKKKKSLFRRILKWTGITFLILLIFIIVAPFLFQKQIFNFVKQEINKNLNAKFDCKDYNLTLIRTFPDFTLELKDVSLKGINEFKDVDLIHAKSILVTLDIKSVLWGDTYEISKIELNDADIHAMILENGKANWDIVKSEEEKAPEDKEPSEFSMQLQKYAVKNTNILYDDRAGGMFVRIANLNHEGTGDFTADRTLLETTTKADTINFKMGGIPFVKNAKADITMNIDMDMVKSRYTFKNNNVKLNEFELGFGGWLEMPDSTMTMDINFDTKKSDFKTILSMVPSVYTKDYSSVKVTGTTSCKGRINGKLSSTSMPAMDIKLKVDNGSFKYPDLPKSATGIFVDASVTSKGAADMDDMVIDVPKFTVNLGGNPIAASFNLTNPMTDMGIAAMINAHLNLATLKDVIPLDRTDQYAGKIDADVNMRGRMSTLIKQDYANFDAKGQILVDQFSYKGVYSSVPISVAVADLRFTPKTLELAKLESTYDNTSISANGNLDNYIPYIFKGDTITGKLNLSSPLIDLGKMMGESTATTTTTASSQQTATVPGESSVIVIPRNINFTLLTDLKKVIYPMNPGKPALELTNVTGAVGLQEGAMLLRHVKMNTLDGMVDLNGTYDTRNENEPAVDFGINVANLDIKKTVATFNTVDKIAPIASKCTGKFSTDMTFKTTMNKQMEPNLNTLTGGGTLAARNIYVEGFEPLNKLAQELKIQKLAKQNIEDVKLSFEFENGKVKIKPYDVKIAGYKTTIAGTTAFTSEIDYDIAMAVPRKEFGGAANSVLDDLVNKANKSGADVKLGEFVNLKIKLTGTVNDPKIKTNLKEQLTDLKEDIKEEIKNKVKEEIKEIKDDAKAKAKEEAAKIIAEAEKGAARIREEAKKVADAQRKAGADAGAQLIKEAGNNPIAKKAAEKGAEKLKKEAEEKAKKTEEEADSKANKLIEDAKARAAKIDGL